MPEVLLHDQAAGDWLHFTQPRRIIQATRLEEVLPALAEIERSVNEDGLHAAGFISYEAAPAFDEALQVRPAPGFPLLWFGLFPAPARSPGLPACDETYSVGEWKPALSRAAYNRAIAAIKDHIARGRTYQVNYTFRLRAEFKGSARALFADMVRAQAAGYSAYIDTGEMYICSASPELFFTLQGSQVTCRPMKGTTRRGRWLAEDETRAAWLGASVKNRAENVMIVDMIRNDLGRQAEIGSVRVPELFTTERYRTLWQMTSTVTASVHASFVDILRALFPCASITGAPKVSTMQIIAALETTPRRLYTGTIGVLSPGRHAQFSVAIRTLLVDARGGQAEYGVGGGIVWDSTASDEYAEALLKARVLTRRHPEFSLLETLRWDPAEDIGYTLLNEHLRRLENSAAYFTFPFRRADVENYLEGLANTLSPVAQVVRILLSANGDLTHETRPLPPPAPTLNLALARTPVDSQDVYLYHKTTRREGYEQSRRETPGFDDALLFNERGELTETTIANLVVELDGHLLTPRLDCGLLPGTLRAKLLAEGRVAEAVILVSDLPHCTQLFLINSVRGWCPAKIHFPDRP